MHSEVVRRFAVVLQSLSHLRSSNALVYAVAWCVACAASGCGSTVATSTGPSPTKCGVTLTPPAAALNSSGATTTVAVNTQAECTWTASSEVNWITGMTPASGQGTAQLRIDVAANPDATARQGDILVNGERARIRQDAAPCRFDLSSTEQSFASSGGSGKVSITALAGCTWSAQADAPWVVVTSAATGSGPGSVDFSVAPNAGQLRSASLVVGDRTLRISQDAFVPPPVNCTYSVSPRDVSAPAAGNEVSVSVTAPAPCDWSASTSASWISLAGRSGGTGNGTFSFSIASNAGAARTGTVAVAGQTISVSQASASCSFSIAPLTASVAAAGGAGPPISVQTLSGCTWNAVTNAAWLSITSGASGNGNGSVGFSALPNSGAARTGTLTIAGQSITVTQAAASSCSFTVAPTTVSVPSTGTSSSSVSVTTSSGCAWTAASNISWLTVLSGAAGTGNGTVTFSAAANTGAARTGTLTVANQTVTVNQAAVACSYAVSPTSASIGATGGSGTPVSVTTSSGCAWTASSNVNWLTIGTGATGTGSGTVTYSAQQNTGAARMGTLTVAGQTVTISQGACSYTIAPTSQDFANSGGPGGPVTVTTQSGCAWTAASNASWITVTSGASGTGSGAVAFTVAANTGGARTGTLTIAGSTFTVTQQKK